MLLANVDHKQQLKKAYKICPDASILTLAMVCARIDRQNSYRVFWVFAYYTRGLPQGQRG